MSAKANGALDAEITAKNGTEPIHVGTAIVGAGLSGIGIAIKLKQQGQNDLAIFDKEEGVGGTWRVNTYPGVECDIYPQLYSYSFAPKKDWSKNYGTQPELVEYIEHCVDRFDLRQNLRLGHELRSARWNSERNLWEMETSQGLYTANVLISAMGYLSNPNIPAIKGLDSFAGPKFHTADWDHDIDLADKRVAIIGVGASSIQIVPEVQPLVARLDIYQRSPAWFMEKHSHKIAGFGAWARRNVPGYHSLLRAYQFCSAELVPFQLARPYRAKFMKDIAQKYLDKKIKDPELHKKLQPDYAIGCKRMLFSDTFYDVVQEPNVDLITEGIERIEADAIVTENGERREIDVLVLATGYGSSNHACGRSITGASGRTLAETWSEGQFAYVGSTVPDFPNFFLMLGPNTTVGHTSMTLMIEAQMNYVADAIKTMQERSISRVEVKAEVASEYDKAMQNRLAPTVWNAGGCTSYYRGGLGKNTAIWPDTSIRFKRKTKRFDVENYDTSAG